MACFMVASGKCNTNVASFTCAKCRSEPFEICTVHRGVTCDQCDGPLTMVVPRAPAAPRPGVATHPKPAASGSEEKKTMRTGDSDDEDDAVPTAGRPPSPRSRSPGRDMKDHDGAMDTDTLRVLSWNMQKHKSSSDHVLKHLAAWGCEIACLQEPIAGFRRDLTIREWECRWFPDADCSLVYVKSKVKLTKVELLVPKERPIDANARAYLVAECAHGSFKWVLVTCHSPYKDAMGNATAFMQQLFTGLKARYAANVVIIAGDTNIYGPHKLDRITTDLVCALASPTSNKGQGSPLDQVYLSKKALLCCPHVGRIVMPKTNPKKLSSADAASSRVKDFEIEYDTQLFESDHIPIYIDVTVGHGASAGAASAAAGAAGGGAAMDEGNASELAREAAKLATRRGGAADVSAEALGILGRCEALLKRANLGEASSATVKAAAESIYTICTQLGHGAALPKARVVVTALQSHASVPADVKEQARKLLTAWKQVL